MPRAATADLYASFSRLHGLVMRQAALGAVSQSAAATRQLLQCLPPLATLTARHPASDQAAWLADAVMASRMQFLMGLLTACAAAAPQVSRAEVLQRRCSYVCNAQSQLAATNCRVCTAVSVSHAEFLLAMCRRP